MLRALALRQGKELFTLRKGSHSKRQPTHSLWSSAYPHQPYVDTLYVLPPRQRIQKLVLAGTSIPSQVYCTLDSGKEYHELTFTWWIPSILSLETAHFTQLLHPSVHLNLWPSHKIVKPCYRLNTKYILESLVIKSSFHTFAGTKVYGFLDGFLFLLTFKVPQMFVCC